MEMEIQRQRRHSGRCFNLGDLPLDIFHMVCDRLDEDDPPSVRILREAEVTSDKIRCESNPLKNLSCVSKMWRALVLPHLFKYTRLEVRWSTRQCAQYYVYHRAQSLLRFLEANDLKGEVGSLVIYCSHSPSSPPYESKGVYSGLSSSQFFARSLWWHLFPALNPPRITLVGPPVLLSDLAGVGPAMDVRQYVIVPPAIEGKVFFVLCLEQSDRGPLESDSSFGFDTAVGLLYAGRWTRLSLNEGTTWGPPKHRIYYQFASPTSRSLLELLEFRMAISELRSVSYTSVYPLSRVAIALASFANRCIRLETLEVRFTANGMKLDVAPEVANAGMSLDPLKFAREALSADVCSTLATRVPGRSPLTLICHDVQEGGLLENLDEDLESSLVGWTRERQGVWVSGDPPGADD
ncbi:MAG: hypothetical protein M1838_004367 [Thelocarpon superellum]|nr:MAG: hypothetical protein M1838_004367 [Thelocarpon superellum]